MNLNRNKNYISFYYDKKKNIISNNQFKLNLLIYFLFNINKKFLIEFLIEFYYFYRIFNKINSLNFFRNSLFSKFFSVGLNTNTPYSRLFYYKKEKKIEIKYSNLLKINLGRFENDDGSHFYENFCNKNKFKNWNLLNFDLISYNRIFLKNNLFNFLDFFFIYSNNLKKKSKKLNKLFFKKTLLTPYWYKKIFIFKKFLIISYNKKKTFLKQCVRLFWKTKLKYFFTYFIKVKNNINLYPLFKFLKIELNFFIFYFFSLIYSKYFFLIDYNVLKLKIFELIFDNFIYFCYLNKKKFNCFLYYLFYFRWFLFKINYFISIKKIFFSYYQTFNHVEKLNIYFFNLLNDSTAIDGWLEKKNLCSLKLSFLFTKILFIIDLNFNLKRRPWHSFFYRFFDMLNYIKLMLSMDRFFKYKKILIPFYRIFLKLLKFIKKNKNLIRKKSFKSKPVRMGMKVYL